MTIFMLNLDVTTFIASLACATLIYVILKRIIHRWNFNFPPGPRGLPVVGSLDRIDHVSLLDHRDKYGDISYISVLGTDIVVLNSIEVIRDALQGPTADAFSVRPPSMTKTFLHYEDIIIGNPHEKHWKKLRRIFHSLLRAYGEGKMELERVVTTELGVIIGILDKNTGEGLNMKDVLDPSLINILDILTMGERNDYDDSRVVSMRKDLTVSTSLNMFPRVKFITKTSPIWRLIPFGPNKKIMEKLKTRHKDLEYVYNKGEANNEGHGIVYEMFRLKNEHTWINDNTIFGVLQNVYLAGYLTTGNSLYSFFLILLHYPEIQARIQKEIDENIGTGRNPTITDRTNLPFTQAAILELTRYSSILVGSVPHACAEDTTFRGYTVPRGSIIFPNLFRIHHDEQLWDNPWKYDPTRFLDEDGCLLASNHPNRQNLIPFGIGKRMCLGEVFAKTRIFLYVTFLLQRFTFKPHGVPPSCDTRDFLADLIIRPKDYKLVVEKRNKKP